MPKYLSGMKLQLPERFDDINHGILYAPSPGAKCSKNYWSEYRSKDQTDMGRALTEYRHSVILHNTRTLEKGVDIGIGGGAFVEAAGCMGYDICDDAVKWLKVNDNYWNWKKPVDWATFWDSLEHLTFTEHMLMFPRIRSAIFTSIPIFDTDKPYPIQKWKHYKPGEHIWYFTLEGFLRYMHWHGFRWILLSAQETILGRRDILTFGFRRFRPPRLGRFELDRIRRMCDDPKYVISKLSKLIAESW